MNLANFLKSVRRQARIEARFVRINTLTERASEAGDTSTVEALEKETARRAAEHNFLKLRNEADLEDNPAWKDAHDAMRSAVLAGSRGSGAAKALMASADAPAAPAAEAPATE
jgi:hypothetical protein